jgi:hypothetical protein
MMWPWQGSTPLLLGLGKFSPLCCKNAGILAELNTWVLGQDVLAPFFQKQDIRTTRSLRRLLDKLISIPAGQFQYYSENSVNFESQT